MEIGSEADVVRACQEGGALAERLGFSRTERAHVVTAISEVAGNIWLYAGRGRVELAAADEPSRIGITVIARDAGPGIADVESAMRDGYSTRGGMGLGLPGARRLMDDFSVVSEVDRGTTVTMARWRPKPGTAVPARPLVEWASAPIAAESPGHSAVVRPFANGILIAAVGGLGGGEQAARAGRAAASVLERDASDSPIALLQRCHEALRETRGAALALASFSELDARMTWLAVGGAEGLLLRVGSQRPPARETAPSHRGVLGRRLPPLRASTVPVMQADTLVLSSGGPVVPPGYEPAGEWSSRQIAEGLLRDRAGAGQVVVARFLRGARERRPRV